jgi:phosphoribosyl-AMP cyclohydrolase / phosphoribosyl-ATP pyrophosphohydrolase
LVEVDYYFLFSHLTLNQNLRNFSIASRFSFLCIIVFVFCLGRFVTLLNMSAFSPEYLASAIPIEAIRYNDVGLVPAIAQDYLDGTVLMMAWMNRESVQKTLATGEAWYWSRSRQELWHKGATSGHIQKIRSLRYDCDSDALLLSIEQVGDIACHTGERSCFHRLDGTVVPPTADSLSNLYRTILDRQANPSDSSYTCKLLAGGDNKILKKIGEESAEVVMACKDQDANAIANEVADLFYHTLVALAHHRVSLREVYRILDERSRS